MDFQDNTYIKAEGVYYGGILKDVKKHRDPLQPVFEAFTNSLESISSLRGGLEKAFIVVKLFFHEDLLLQRQFYKLTIEDNGVGFNDTEFKRFNTYKDDRKGFHNKGSGRIQLIHFFVDVEFDSRYKQGEKFYQRKFRISKSPNFIQENTITYLESTKLINQTSPLTVVSLQNFRDERDKTHYNISLEQLKERLLTHYIQYFCSHREILPEIKLQAFLKNATKPFDEIEILASDIPDIDSTRTFSLNYYKLSPDGRNLIETENKENFTIKAFRIKKTKLDRNAIKLTSKEELVEKNELKLSVLSPEDYVGEDRFLFLVSSDFINKRDDDVRGELKIFNRDSYKKEPLLFSEEEIFIDDIEEAANSNIVSMYGEIKQKNEEKQVRIEELKSMFLLNDEVLHNISISLNDTEDKILEKVYAAEAKLIAKGDSEIKKQIDELEQLNPISEDYEVNFNAAINKLVKEIPQQNRVALIHYVARRKLVLELLEKILNRKLAIQNAGHRNIDEKLLHNLIFKQNTKTPDTSELWLVNEDFILFKGASESKLRDLEIDGVKVFKEILTPEETKYQLSLNENRYDKRPDILLFPAEGKCIIIEFKAPDVNVSEHINQINRYASLIRNLSKDEFNFESFYGYLVGESLDPDDIRDFDADFRHATHFDYVFRPFKTIAGKFGRSDGSLYTEVIKYSTLLERAKQRNNIFIQKLYDNRTEEDDMPF